MAWSLTEKVGSIFVQLGVSLVLLRLLAPEVFLPVAILNIFATIALVIVDSGFSQALIRKSSPEPGDYKSVFIFNIAVSWALYLLIVGASPWIAGFYGMSEFAQVAPVFFLILPVNALCTVQTTIFTREFRFALLSKVTFASSCVSGFAAIGMAVAGFGLWSIVAQRLVQMAVRAALLWWLSSWRPRGSYGVKPLRQMAPYSLSLMATDLISAFYVKLPQLFIGRIYSGSNLLAFFDQAIKIKDAPVTAASGAVQGVTFPALSKIKDDASKFAESYRQVMMIVAYLLFPVMLGLSAVARDMFDVLLNEKWMPSASYFEVVCLVGLFYPIGMVAFNVLKVQSSGKIIVRTEVLKKILMTIVFALTIPVSVKAVTWGLVVISFCELTVNFVASLRFTDLTVARFLHTMLPVVLVSGAMYAAVRLTGEALPGNPLLRLVAEVAVGAVVYVGLSALFRLEAFRETLSIIKKQVARN